MTAPQNAVPQLEGGSMKYYGKAEDSAKRIMEAFKSGNLPKALAPIFVQRKDGVPCREWSWAISSFAFWQERQTLVVFVSGNRLVGTWSKAQRPFTSWRHFSAI